MAGISSKAAGKLENRTNKFQGQEFTDDLGVNGYEFKYRMHDPQMGRFWQIDPLANDYVYNSTYAFSENKVTGHVELEGLEAKLAIAGVGHGDEGTFKGRAQNYAKATGATVSQTKNGNEVVSQMKQATASEGSISSITFFSHSGGTGLYLNKDEGLYTGKSAYGYGEQQANVNDIKNGVSSGDIKFDANAVVVFAGCNTNSTDQLEGTQQSLATSFTALLGVTTYGAVGKVSPEVVDGKETGRVTADKGFYKNEVTTTMVPYTVVNPFTGVGTTKYSAQTSVTSTFVGRTIDPKALIPQTQK